MDDNILSGSIDNFKFRSEIDGYAVASIDTGKKLVVCTGIFPHCNVGQYIDCVGKYIVDSKYGQQFRAETIRVSSPKDNQSIIKYLSSGFIKGLGPKTAERIVNKFGKDTLDVMEFRPTQLLKISGVTAAKLVEIRESIVKIRQMERAITFLQSKGLGTKACLKIYEAYGDNTVDIVANNPYQLIEDIDGIGFLTADKIAHEIGIPHNSTFRVRAGLLYVLRASTEKEGNTYLPYDICIDQTIQLLQLETSSSLNDVSVVEYDANELVDSVIQELSIDYKIKVVNVDDIKVVMTMQCHQVERRIADMLIQLQSHAIATSLDYVEELEEFEKVNNIRLHQAQKDAIRLSVNSGVCIVTGGPGTGKTTIIRNILSIFQKYKMRVTMLAPTGRAAKRILESTGYEAKTIHRALAWGGGQATRSTSLVADVIIVDEVSMVDIFLFNNLLGAIEKGTKLILVGDKDQLPSVGAGNVLRDLLVSDVLPIAQLSFIYRQGDESLIAKNAHNINSGVMPDINNNKADFFFVNSNTNTIAESVCNLVVNRLPSYTNLDSSRIQVLSALKNGTAGVIALNKHLQNLLNPYIKGEKQITTDDWNFRKNDKVMHIVNNYKLKWKNQSTSEEGEGVFNGDMGKIINILDNGEIVVLFEDDRVVYYSSGERVQLMLSYAITVHKSQGSEFDVVVMPVISGSPMILTRNLLYTAITRAKKMVVLVGSEYAIQRMVENNYIAMRYSALWWFLKKPNLSIQSSNLYKLDE